MIVARGEGLGGWVKKVKGLRGNMIVMDGDVKYSKGNIIDNTIITMPGARWVLEVLWGNIL